MKSNRFRTVVIFLGFFLIVATVWLGGCASTPPGSERPDRDRIKQNSDKSMQDLQREEDRRGTDGY